MERHESLLCLYLRPVVTSTKDEGLISQEAKDECRRLRVEENLSLSDIAKRTGLSKGTLSVLLRDTPLPESIVRVRQQENARRTAALSVKPRSPVLVDVSGYTTHELGRISEAAVLFRLTLHRFNAMKPTFEGDVADWVIRTDDGRYHRVQVKTVREGKQGLPLVSLRNSHNHSRYKAGDFDFIVGYDIKTDTAYVWAYQELKHLSSTVTVTPESEEAWHKIGM